MGPWLDLASGRAITCLAGFSGAVGVRLYPESPIPLNSAIDLKL